MTTKSKFHRGIIKSTEKDDVSFSYWHMPHFGKNTKRIETIEQIQEDIEKLRQTAKDEGYKAGFEAGFTEGSDKAYKEGKRKIDEKLKIFEDLISCFNNPIRDFTEMVQRQLLDLLRILFKVSLAKEIEINPDLIKKVIIDALECLPVNEEKKFIYLNPEDKIVFDEMWKECGNDLSEKYGLIVFNEFENLSRGEVLVRSKHSTIDTSVEKRMMNILNEEIR